MLGNVKMSNYFILNYYITNSNLISSKANGLTVIIFIQYCLQASLSLTRNWLELAP